LPAVLSAIEQDTDNTFFLYSKWLKLLYGLVEAAQDFKPKKEKLHS
jgi:hypothetical protein